MCAEEIPLEEREFVQLTVAPIEAPPGKTHEALLDRMTKGYRRWVLAQGAYGVLSGVLQDHLEDATPAEVANWCFEGAEE